MTRKAGAGICVHCLKEVEVRTWDHVFPKGWYPEDTPADIEKWKIPSCRFCNAEYGSLEEDLGIRIAFCIGPNASGAKGIYEKALRSMDASQGRNMKDRIRRAQKRDKYLGMLVKNPSVPESAIYPGFEERWGRPPEERIALYVPVKGLQRIVEKIVKGIAFIEDDRLLEASVDIKHHPMHENTAAQFNDLLARFGESHSRGPGVEVTRAVTPEDGISALYKIVIWGQWIMYASVRQGPAQQDATPDFGAAPRPLRR